MKNPTVIVLTSEGNLQMNLLVRTCNYNRMNMERVFARGFVIAGGIVWIAAVFGAMNAYLGKTVAVSTLNAAIPLALAVVVFVVGWFYERLASAILAVASVGVIVWGMISGWEAGVWMSMGVALIAPMAVAALLYLLAAQTQTVCELSAEKE